MGDTDSWERLIAEVESLAGGPVPDEAERGLVVLEIPLSADRGALAKRLAELGPPIDVNIVSPPILDPARPGAGPDWEVKQSVCHEIAGRRVWFGTEKTGGVERLVSVTIHFDAPTEVKTAEPTEFLPPEKRDGPFRLTMSIGWCGGHGEAVLNDADRPRRHDDLPIFVDGRSAEEIVGRVDLRGTWIGSPKVKIAGTGRLKRMRSRNASIPGAPKERYVSLIVSELLEARLVGERAED